MRARRLVVIAACAALALAGCSGETEEAPESVASSPVVESPSTPEIPTPAPDAPEGGVFAASDEMAHTMCRLWTTELEDPSDLRGVVEDLDWYGQQATNDFIRSPASSDEWGSGNVGETTVLCRWNGYEAEDGSPADLLS